MFRTFFLCTLVATSACSFGDDRPLGGGGGDAGPDGTMDGPPVVEKDHLLLTEIKSTGTDEFIEIWNPTNRDIDLGNYYLSDFGDYWRYPTGQLAVVAADFIVRFPAGAMLRSKQVITVATKAAPFQGTFPAGASYALDITTDAGTTRTFRDRLVSANVAQLPTITDGGEIVVLFYWDGTSDLVKDVDIALAGTSTTDVNNNFKSKTQIDGPDADTTASAYKAENGLLGGGMSSVAAGNTTYKRRLFETGNETQSGTGNGITGDDETSEALMATWDGDAAAAHSAPNPGTAPSI